MAALRGLVAKIRIPCSSALRFSRSSSSLPKGDFENALLLKNKIEAAKVEDLWSSGNLIDKHCEQTEQIISQFSERHAKVSRAFRSLTLKYFCTGVVIGSLQYLIESYYYDKAEFELAERQLAAERQRQVEAE